MDESTQLLMTFLIEKLAAVAGFMEETVKQLLPAATQKPEKQIELMHLISK